MHNFEYFRPETTAEAATLLEQTGGRILAGGTDILPRCRRGAFPAGCLVDFGRLNELCFIREEQGWIEIGALTTHADLADSLLLQAAAPALVRAAAGIGSPQTRQRGTLGGNLANASPAADLAPPLLVLQAEIRLASARGERRLPLEEFWLAPGETRLAAGEYLHSLVFRRPQGRWGQAFIRLGKRNGMAIAVASAAALFELDPAERLISARLALGSLAPKPLRSPGAERTMAGQAPDAALFAAAAQAALTDIDPISDVRASSAYRAHAGRVLAQRSLEEAWQQASRRSA